MHKLTRLSNTVTTTDDTLTLAFDTRQKSRLSVCTDSGVEVGILLPRGHSLRSGQVLSTDEDDFTVLVKAASEPVSIMHSDDALQFARACYHLGNRHVPLQILPGELRYLADHVLDHMLAGLGLAVKHGHLPFEPESGAYHGHDH